MRQHFDFLIMVDPRLAETDCGALTDLLRAMLEQGNSVGLLSVLGPLADQRRFLPRALAELLRDGRVRWLAVPGPVDADIFLVHHLSPLLADADRITRVAARRCFLRVEQPLDERYADPSPPICDACTSTTPAGRWGEGQKFSDGAARKAITASTDQLAALGTALDDHLPRLEDAARLARDPATSKVARAYGKQLHDSVLYLGKGRLQLDDAAVFRSEKLAREVGSAATEHVESLASAYDKLLAAVGKEVGRAHGGNYAESDAQGPKAPYLQVSIDGAKVTATYFAGGGQSIWFDGEVALDGGITGRSLVAPESGTLTCQQHAESCGYVYIPSVLRFTERQDPDEKSVQTAELWFQRSTWVMAKPFTR